MKPTKLTFLTLLFISFTFLLSCSSDNDDESITNGDELKITSIEPTSAKVGEEVTITLNGFAENAKIMFNETEANITNLDASDNSTVITAKVPMHATTGKLKVTVEEQDILSASDFEVILTPVSELISFTPTTGEVGDEVVIELTNISIPLSDLEVYFGELEASIFKFDEATNNGIRSVTLSVIVPTNAVSSTVTIKSDDNIIIQSIERFNVEAPATLTDKDILTLLYNANPDNTLTWDISASSMAMWEDLDVDSNGRVTRLVLDNKNISIIPEEFGALSELRDVFLYNNNIERLPDSFGNLSKLVILNINNNKLRKYPVVLEKLGMLEYLGISENEIRNLPASISNLSANLVSFNLDYNKIISLPPEIGQLTSLKNLSIKENLLGSLPSEIGNLNLVWTMDLTGNFLVTLPDGIGNMTDLEILHLESNDITNLPETFGNLNKLKELYLDFNELALLPSSFGNLSALDYLKIDNNNLSLLPNSFATLPKLKNLEIYKNKLLRLPEEIGDLPQIRSINLSDNNLEFIPESLGNSTTITSLNLTHNKITTIPASLGNLNTLVGLYLSNNKLIHIPDEIGNLTSLISLNLTNNLLTSIPQEVCDLGTGGTNLTVDGGVTCY